MPSSPPTGLNHALEVGVVDGAPGSTQVSVTDLTENLGVKDPMANANMLTSASVAERKDMVKTHVKIKEQQNRNFLPRWRRWAEWDSETPIPSADWTLTALPLPQPPNELLRDPVFNETINKNPHLFSIVTPVNISRFEQLLNSHPNRPFVDSVITGLRKGFWPFADIPAYYPDTHDASNKIPDDPVQAEFLRTQRDIELSKNRYSPGFDSLLPGMYAMPLHAVPKDEGTSLRLVTNHSKEPFSLNSMIDKIDMGSFPLDNMKHLGSFIITLHRLAPEEELILWKSDVAEAYRLIPMHPL